MNKAHLLGYSSYTISVIVDMIKEMKKVEVFVLYPNLKNTDEPIMPVVQENFEIMPLGCAPKKSSKVFFGTANPKNKQAIFDYFYKNHFISEDQYDSIIHPSAFIAPSSQLEKGVLIEPGVVVSSQSKLDFGVYVKRGSLIGHHNIIGAYTDINPGVVISGVVTIGKLCAIGSGTIIKNNIKIGNNTIIGIGSVVTSDIPSNCIAYGNPCKVIRKNNLS